MASYRPIDRSGVRRIEPKFLENEPSRFWSNSEHDFHKFNCCAASTVPRAWVCVSLGRLMVDGRYILHSAITASHSSEFTCVIHGSIENHSGYRRMSAKTCLLNWNTVSHSPVRNDWKQSNTWAGVRHVCIRTQFECVTCLWWQADNSECNRKLLKIRYATLMELILLSDQNQIQLIVSPISMGSAWPSFPLWPSICAAGFH